MEDIRREIDALDQIVIKSVGQAFHYVLAAKKPALQPKAGV